MILHRAVKCFVSRSCWKKLRKNKGLNKNYTNENIQPPFLAHLNTAVLRCVIVVESETICFSRPLSRPIPRPLPRPPPLSANQKQPDISDVSYVLYFLFKKNYGQNYLYLGCWALSWIKNTLRFSKLLQPVHNRIVTLFQVVFRFCMLFSFAK